MSRLALERMPGVPHEVRGDAVVAEFPTASSALEAALLFQAEHSSSNEAGADDITPRIRIGIAMGEVLVADGTVTGEAVVMAQRLEQLAEPDGVCVQGSVRDLIPARYPFEYTGLGDKKLKGFRQPVRTIRVALQADAQLPEADRSRDPEPHPKASRKAGAPTTSKPSILVLPLRYLSEDPAHEFLADGITEDLITALGQLVQFEVISRGTAFSFKGNTSVTAQELGLQLGVRYVLEGVLRHAAQRVRVNVGLVDTRKATQIWAQRFDRILDDVFELQDEIATAIVGAIEPQILKAEADRLRLERPGSLSEWELVVGALPDVLSLSRDRMTATLDDLQHAIGIAPGYARAHGTFGLCHALMAWMGWDGLRDTHLRAPAAAGRKAVQLNANDPSGHVALGLTAALERQHRDALAELRTALSLSPNSVHALAYFGTVSAWNGDLEASLEALQTAERLSPMDPFRSGVNIPAMRATPLYLAGRFDESLYASREGTRLSPDAAGPLRILAASTAQMGKQHEAGEAMSRLLRVQPQLSARWMRENFPLSNLELLELYVQGLRLAGMPE